MTKFKKIPPSSRSYARSDTTRTEINLCKLCRAEVKDEHPRCKGCNILAGEGHLVLLDKEGYCRYCQSDLKRLPRAKLVPTQPTMTISWLQKKCPIEPIDDIY